MTTRFTFDIPYVNDDGDALVVVYESGEEFSRHWVRIDQARQWGEQEVYELERRTSGGYDSLTREADR